jgi:hypothetical protein
MARAALHPTSHRGKRSKKGASVERVPMPANRTAFILGLALLAFAVLFFLVAVTGMLWPASPVTDVGVLSVTSITLLFGLGALALSRYPTPEPPQN